MQGHTQSLDLIAAKSPIDDRGGDQSFGIEAMTASADQSKRTSFDKKNLDWKDFCLGILLICCASPIVFFAIWILKLEFNEKKLKVGTFFHMIVDFIGLLFAFFVVSEGLFIVCSFIYGRCFSYFSPSTKTQVVPYDDQPLSLGVDNNPTDSTNVASASEKRPGAADDVIAIIVQ